MKSRTCYKKFLSQLSDDEAVENTVTYSVVINQNQIIILITFSDVAGDVMEGESVTNYQQHQPSESTQTIVLNVSGQVI